MKNRQIRTILLSVSLIALSQHIWAEEVVHFSAEEAINIVSQKLNIAQSQNDAAALKAAKNNISAISTKDGKEVYRHLTPEQTFSLQLQILQVADKMQDKAYNRNIMPKEGIYGNVPWPSKDELPEELRGEPLWWPRTPPEYYKERNPELYAFYKPLYEKNQQNTTKHQHEGCIRAVRNRLLREVKTRLTHQGNRGEKTQDSNVYRGLVDEIITDRQLLEEILSDTPIEYRLPEKQSEEKAVQ